MERIILISNDDGYQAKGIDCLLKFVAPVAQKHNARIVVMAPDGPRSGNSSAITHDGPITLRTLPDHITGARMYAVGGTPVDCIKLGLHLLNMKNEKPALIISGINHGSNSAVSVNYSGTMGCAIEGATNGIPSVGFSLLDYMPDADFSGCESTITTIVDSLLSQPLPDRVCLNVNIPAHCEPKGVKLTRAARGYWTEEYKEYSDPIGRPFFWLTGRFHNIEPDSADTDEYWLKRGWSTVVAVPADMGVAEEVNNRIATTIHCDDATI